MALSVPLSRFTPRTGGGSAFFVRPLDHAMKTLVRLICGFAGGHFVLCWLVIGILQWFGWDYFFWFGRELFLPLIPLEVTLWPPYNWFTFILTVALNSGIWGVVIGLLLYGVRRTFYKPVA